MQQPGKLQARAITGCVVPAGVGREDRAERSVRPWPLPSEEVTRYEVHTMYMHKGTLRYLGSFLRGQDTALPWSGQPG